MAISLIQLNKEIQSSIPNKEYILEAEVSGVSSKRGNTYFNFKEKDDKLFGTIWKSTKTSFKIKDGDKIKCSGRVRYSPTYGLSFVVNKILSNSGVGDIFNELVELKKNLKAEGLFSKEYKKYISGLIEEVEIITSQQGAAIQDILRNLNNHNSAVKVNIIDVAVQGVNCSREVSYQINKLNEEKNKIVIITRGGGDYLDLNGFNQEEVVRSIFDSKNIVISAIGHETDRVLSDFVADYSYPTPSLVAQFIVDHNNDIITNWKNKLDNLEDNIFDSIRDNYDFLRDIEQNLLEEENKIDMWISKLEMELMEEIYEKEKTLTYYINYIDNVINDIESKIDDLEDNVLDNIRNEFNYLRDTEQILLEQDNKLDMWLNKIEMDIMQELYQKEKILNEYFVYLDSVGEIKLLNKKQEEFNNLEDIGQLFIDNCFFLKIKDRLFKINNFDFTEKII